MKLDCKIIESLQREFNTLWTCQQRGETLEISVPYLRPDSALHTLYLTRRAERYIVCDGGDLMELVAEYCPLPAEEAAVALDGIASQFGMKRGTNNEGIPLFFKECTEPRAFPDCLCG